MPCGNKRGPEGHGPRTGRGLGFCGNTDLPGYMQDQGRRGGQMKNRQCGRMSGRGRRMRGHGRDHRNFSFHEQTIDEEEYLIETLETLNKELLVVQDRLTKIQSKQDNNGDN